MKPNWALTQFKYRIIRVYFTKIWVEFAGQLNPSWPFLVSWGHSLTQLNSKIGSAWLGSSKILVRICRNSLKTLWFPGCKLMNYKIHISTIICYRCKNIRKCLRVWRRNSKVIQSKFMAAVCGYQSLHTLDSSNHQSFNLHPDFWNSRSWEIKVYFKP